MPNVKCSIDGCDRKLQPIWKVDRNDRSTWLYRECDTCLRPVCVKHSREDQHARIICNACREAPRQHLELIQLDALRGDGP